MLNGDSLSPGYVFNKNCYATSYPLYQGALFLPKPNDSHQYLLLHFQSDDWTWDPRFLLYSAMVDTGDNGLGQVIEKNQVVFEDIELSQYLTATRHANGRDWWIIAPERRSNVYQVCLLTPDGVRYVGSQTLGNAESQYWAGQTAFSPDGSKYFKVLIDGLRVMDFNRCTGQLSNYQFLPHPETAGGGGVAVSSSGRFLYTSDGSHLYQFDLQAPNLEASRERIATYDGYESPFSTAFYQGMLAPDGQIYWSTGSTNNVMHVIHHPDLPGAACDVEQHGLQLPALMGWYTPNFINYRLGPLDCSACDTLNLDNLPQAAWNYETDTLDPFSLAFHDLSSCALSWHWDFGDSTSSTEQHPAHTYAQAGLYTVCLTATNANGTSVHCDTLRVGFTAQNDPGVQRRVEVWPNPFGTQLNVAYSARLPSPVFRLSDAAGRLLRAAPLAFGISEVDTGDLLPGIYFWEVWSRGGRVKAGKAVKVF